MYATPAESRNPKMGIPAFGTKLVPWDTETWCDTLWFTWLKEVSAPPVIFENMSTRAAERRVLSHVAMTVEFPCVDGGSIHKVLSHSLPLETARLPYPIYPSHDVCRISQIVDRRSMLQIPSFLFWERKRSSNTHVQGCTSTYNISCTKKKWQTQKVITVIVWYLYGGLPWLLQLRLIDSTRFKLMHEILEAQTYIESNTPIPPYSSSLGITWNVIHYYPSLSSKIFCHYIHDSHH